MKDFRLSKLKCLLCSLERLLKRYSLFAGYNTYKNKTTTLNIRYTKVYIFIREQQDIKTKTDTVEKQYNTSTAVA